MAHKTPRPWKETRFSHLNRLGLLSFLVGSLLVGSLLINSSAHAKKAVTPKKVSLITTKSPKNQPLSPEYKMTLSDKYCEHLEKIHAGVVQVVNPPSAIENLIQFAKDFTNKLYPLTEDETLKKLEKQAIEDKLTFEDFRERANQDKKTAIPLSYKGEYIKNYMEKYCGEITHISTFGGGPNEERQSKAQKQIDSVPGHAYFETMPAPPSSGTNFIPAAQPESVAPSMAPLQKAETEADPATSQ